MRNVEILAPAGSYESLCGAINGGCDAVYLGGSKFGARAFAENFDEETMLRAIDYVHLFDKKIYLTVNTLLHNEEIEEEEVAVEWAAAQAVYDASLATSAKVVQKSLLDFL